MSGEEGWYTDPFGLHEARWMSDGQATNLVRDKEVESHDPPPDEPFKQVPQPIEAPESAGPDDLLRADSAQTGEGYDSSKAVRAALDAFDQTGGQPFGA